MNKTKKTVDFLNLPVPLPDNLHHLPNWLRIILNNSSPSPFIINRNDGDLFDKINRTSRLVEEHEAIVRLLAMITYQDIKIRNLEHEIDRVKRALTNHILFEARKGK